MLKYHGPVYGVLCRKQNVDICACLTFRWPCGCMEDICFPSLRPLWCSRINCFRVSGKSSGTTSLKHWSDWSWCAIDGKAKDVMLHPCSHLKVKHEQIHVFFNLKKVEVCHMTSTQKWTKSALFLDFSPHFCFCIRRKKWYQCIVHLK